MKFKDFKRPIVKILFTCLYCWILGVVAITTWFDIGDSITDITSTAQSWPTPLRETANATALGVGLMSAIIMPAICIKSMFKILDMSENETNNDRTDQR